MIISEKVLKLLKEKGISQKEFSIATGISQSTISDWKTKKNNPASDKILKICEVLEVSPYELLSDEGDNKTAIEPVDYLAVSKGTDLYELVIKTKQLPDAQIKRVLGYVDCIYQDALKQTGGASVAEE